MHFLFFFIINSFSLVFRFHLFSIVFLYNSLVSSFVYSIFFLLLFPYSIFACLFPFSLLPCVLILLSFNTFFLRIPVSFCDPFYLFHLSTFIVVLPPLCYISFVISSQAFISLSPLSSFPFHARPSPLRFSSFIIISILLPFLLFGSLFSLNHFCPCNHFQCGAFSSISGFVSVISSVLLPRLYISLYLAAISLSLRYNVPLSFISTLACFPSYNLFPLCILFRSLLPPILVMWALLFIFLTVSLSLSFISELAYFHVYI